MPSTTRLFLAIGAISAMLSVMLGAFAARFPHLDALRWSGWLMILGIVLFSGSLYVLTLTGIRTFGAVTPFGGVAFILAWAILAVAALKAP